ncbi:hypothetical protein FQN57_007318 [Myotisia sp. PD_48]|nr:hypothetical protein FQN57_007318 [Myotisia sp. PD_48]
MLPSKVRPLLSGPPGHDHEEQEDFFSSFLAHLMPDEAPQCLGQPGHTLLYSSPVFGDLKLSVPDYAPKNLKDNTGVPSGGSKDENANVNIEISRQLFAHYLWVAALVLGDRLEEAALSERHIGTNQAPHLWSVKGHRVLELGAGVALPSVLSILAGASAVTITDHPSSSALYGAIQSNIIDNVPGSLCQTKQGATKISIEPYQWGIFEGEEPPPHTLDSSTPPAVLNKMAQFATVNKASFSRIICVDCLWVWGEHVNLVRTLLWFLSSPLISPSSSDNDNDNTNTNNDNSHVQVQPGRAWVVAGFHNGREIVTSFFETAVAMGLVIEDIWESDVNSPIPDTGARVTREWQPVRDGEGPENRARWCVVAILRK